MTITLIKQRTLIGAICLVVLASVVLFHTRASANPSVYCREPLARATTTHSYLRAGYGTTTLTVDQCAQSDIAADSALLLLQITGTSTAPTLDMRVEYSADKIDWYPASAPLATLATSTQITGDSATTKLILANATTDYGGTGTATRFHRSMEIPMHTRYARVVFTMPAGSAQAALWAELVSRREI